LHSRRRRGRAEFGGGCQRAVCLAPAESECEEGERGDAGLCRIRL
jgi:hypothetical protein